MVVRVASHLDVLVALPGGENKGSIANKNTGFGEVGHGVVEATGGFNTRQVDREPGVGGQTIDEAHMRFDEFDDQGKIVRGAETKRGGVGGAAGTEGLDAHHGVGEIGELGGQGRGDPTLEGAGPLASGYGLTIGPLGIGSQMECVGETVGETSQLEAAAGKTSMASSSH